MSDNQEEQHLQTVRFKLSPEMLKHVSRMRLIGNDLLVYTTNTEELTTTFQQHGINVVDRVYKLHVSAPNEEAFDSVFSEYTIEKNVRSTTPRFVATVTVESQDQYNKLLELGETETCQCRIKSYRYRFDNTNQDDGSDTRERVTKKYSRDHQSREYQPRDQREPREYQSRYKSYQSRDKPTQSSMNGKQEWQKVQKKDTNRRHQTSSI